MQSRRIPRETILDAHPIASSEGRVSKRKNQLLDAIIDHLSREGLSRLSLRPLARVVGSSSRLLVFHFKSKERLILEVINELQTRIEKSFIAVAGAKETNRIDIPLRRYWRWATNEKNLRYLWLLSEAHTLAAVNTQENTKYPSRPRLNWTDIFSSNLPDAVGDMGTRTLCRAVYAGLILELSAGDVEHTTRALEEFVQLLLLRHPVSQALTPSNAPLN